MVNRNTLHRIQDQTFHHLWSRSLVYNACWEDPALDREALALGPDHRVLVITSAGCNALDYALCGIKRVHAVDANPRQGALLELKVAGIKMLDYDDFFMLFGEGCHPAHLDLYRARLRPLLMPFARSYWDRHIRWFAVDGARSSFYFHGLSGLMARIVTTWIRIFPNLSSAVSDMLAARTLEDQRAIWDHRIEPALFTRGVNWWLGRQTTMNMLGVPPEQTAEVARAHADGVAGFIRASMRRVFRELPLWRNYFWSLYLRGSYTRDSSPEYLSAGGFASLKAGRVNAVSIHTDTVTSFVSHADHTFDRFVLLDHMDWMGTKHPDLLAEEWQHLLIAANPGARAIWRSAHDRPTYLDTLRLPHDRSLLKERLRFQPDLSARLHAQDRVGTYGGFHIADIR